VRHNVLDDLTAASWGAGSRPIMIGDGPDVVTVDHNTIISTDTSVFWLYGGTPTSPIPITNAVITNNVAAHNTYGIAGSSFGFGTTAISAYLPAGLVKGNVLAGGTASRYPAGNFFPAVAAWQSGFVDYAGGDYHLSATSPYRNAATDGTDVGADITRVNAEIANAISGDDRLPPGQGHLQITTTALPDGVLSRYYAQTLGCSGGSAACVWQMVDGSLPAGVAFDAVVGAVLGMPTRVETGSLTLSAYDPQWPANNATATLSLTIAPPPLVVSVVSPPAGRVGVAYQLALSVTGVLGSATWSVVSGSLPSGLTLDPFSGAIAGAPTSWGTTTAVVQVQDSWGIDRTDAKPVTITVAPSPLQITTDTLGSVEYRNSYQAMLSASGGTGAASWSVIDGALPSGVTLDVSGAVVGVPTTIGTFPVTVQAIDANWPGMSAGASLVLVVSAPALSVSISSPSSGRVGVPYQGTAAVSGLVGAVTWSVAAGALPPGVGVNAETGAITGVPSTYGPFTAAIQARDSYDPTRIASASLNVLVAPTPIVIATTSLPSVRSASPFSAALGAAGGTGTFAWSLDSGALPDGITLSPNGTLSGSSTTLGSFTFAVRAADAGWPGSAALQSLTLSVLASEVVLYAADATLVGSAWTRVSDASAAGGARLWNADRAAAKVANAVAAPQSYFELTFDAQAGVAYHLWMRGKADKNSWANDSVYAQFSGAIDSHGAALYRIGTTSGASLSIEDGLNAGLAGWGWADNSYGAFADPLYFATTGPQTIRVQVREDGLSLDQIALSSASYLTTAPGATKNDATILPR
jgi:hypothetical protein